MSEKEVKRIEPTDITLFEANTDTGFEKTDAQTYKTPFLKILQTLSPEMSEDNPEYIKGAKKGDFCNSATKQIYKELEIIVLKIEHSLIVWEPNRGAFVGRFEKSEESSVVHRKEGVKKWDSDGNEVVDTIELFCMNADDPMDIFIFPLSTTSLKYGQGFATKMRMLKLDGKSVNVTWAGVWKMTTSQTQNDKGSWYTITHPSFVRFITKEERDQSILPAKKMLKTVETDYLVADPSGDDSSGGEEVF